jgi:hypothetical protein
MDIDDARRAVAAVDERELGERASRLQELEALLDDDEHGFSGQAAQWLFDDVKATWIYGYLTATVVAAHAFCVQQLCGLVRMLPDEPGLPDRSTALDHLAAVAHERGLVDMSTLAQLVSLHDAAQGYMSSNLHEFPAQTERRMAEAEVFADEHVLLTDGRRALECAVALLHRRRQL